MSKYLNPKNDIVFKKIFGDHPRLLKSFLNAVLPLPPDGQIDTLEYLPAEQIPVIPNFKRTIVDVKCWDTQGRIFIVEMQMEWTNSFMQRLLFSTAQAYVKQLKPGEAYELLNPVYGLGLVDSVFDRETAEWYHHYGLVKLKNPQEEIIRGLTLVFVELPKFKPQTREDKQLRTLWFRFMREINEETQEADPLFHEVPEISEALHLAEQAAYTPQELLAYEDYWKTVSADRSGKIDAFKEGEAKGEARGKDIGKTETQREIAKNMKMAGMPITTITAMTGLSQEDISKI